MRQAYSIILRFIVIGLLLLMASYQWGDYLIKLLIPFYEWMVKTLDYRFGSVIFSITKQHGEQFLLLQTTYAMPIHLGTQTIVPNFPIPNAASLPLGNVLLPFILMFTTILAWPNTHDKPIAHLYLVRILIAIPICLMIMMIDVPAQLIKLVWEHLNQLLNLNISQSLHYFTYWSDFLNGGGLIALSIASGILVVGITDYLTKPHMIK
jgi:hypothetical protein